MIHNELPGLTSVLTFPTLPAFSDSALRSFCSNVAKNKALVFDQVSDSLFDPKFLCSCEDKSQGCTACLNRTAMLRVITSASYYGPRASNWVEHFRARIIPLNKKFPAIP